MPINREDLTPEQLQAQINSKALSSYDLDKPSEEEQKAAEIAQYRVGQFGFGPSGYAREIETEKQQALKELETKKAEDEPLPQIPKQLQDVLGKREYATQAPTKDSGDITKLISSIQAKGKEIEPEEGKEEEISSPRMLASDRKTPEITEKKSSLEKALAEAAKKDAEERTKYSDLLKEAVAKRDFTQLIAQLGSAASTIGAGIGGTVERGTVTKPVGEDIYKRMIETASQPISDLERKKTYEIEERKNDPQSAESIAARAIMNEFDIKVPETATAAFLEKQFPAISSLMARREATEAKKEAALDRQRELGLRRQELAVKTAQIQDEKTRNEFVKLQESTDPTKARSGAFGKQYDIVNQGDKLKRLVARASSGFDLTGQELEEVAMAQAAILGASGGRSRSQVQALVPHSLTGEVKKAWQWLSNKPTGTGQQEFVKRIYDTIEREQELARSELKKTIDKRIAVRRHLKEKNPQLFEEVVNDAYSSLGITGGEKGAAGKDPQVQKYADAHFGGNYNDALNFLENRRKK